MPFYTKLNPLFCLDGCRQKRIGVLFANQYGGGVGFSGRVLLGAFCGFFARADSRAGESNCSRRRYAAGGGCAQFADAFVW